LGNRFQDDPGRNGRGVGGDTVIVAEGTYVENIFFKGKNIILRSTDFLNSTIVESTRIMGSQNGSVVSFSGT